VDELLAKKRQKRHKLALRKVRASIDMKAPLSARGKKTSSGRNGKRRQIENERRIRIQRENNMLIRKILDFDATNARVRETEFYRSVPRGVPRSLNSKRRSKKLQKITKENKKMLDRIIHARPTFSKSSWKSDEKKRKKLMRNMAANSRFRSRPSSAGRRRRGKGRRSKKDVSAGGSIGGGITPRSDSSAPKRTPIAPKSSKNFMGHPTPPRVWGGRVVRDSSDDPYAGGSEDVVGASIRERPVSRGRRTVSSEQASYSRPVGHDDGGGVGVTNESVLRRPVSRGGRRVADSEVDHGSGARPVSRSGGGGGGGGIESLRPTVVDDSGASDARDSAADGVTDTSSHTPPASIDPAPTTTDVVAAPAESARAVDAGDSSSEDEEWMNSLR